MSTSTVERRPAAAEATRPRRRRRSGEALVGYLLVAPVVALFVVFSAYPLLRTAQISLTDWDGLSSHFDYVGLANYSRALTDRIWGISLWHGLLFAVVALTVMQGIGLALAVAVARLVRSAGIYRVVFYLPPILSAIVVALVWKWFYQPHGGPLNELLASVGLDSVARPWLSDSSTALWAVSAASVWQGVGTPFLFFLAAVQAVPTEQLEAATMDGAGAWRRFRAVTLPSIMPVIGLVSVLTLLGAMQIFNLVLAMTNGGPGYDTEVPVLNIYRNAFELGEFGYATAQSIIFGLVLFVVSGVAMVLSRRRS
ncbi:carbohydrate ABC transporter permease [Jiangella alba]|uniref:Raffinose/stachyose/melibiose transport system permease protein n=1 Tax=Jiangella alba TaxID=561176 RepID=A0A1H5IKP2_9ACTN|nr:sugar ABC transporter permease [Jiangella alba]SEE40614.1 raffinose/stachyose/melibiose transport system permease protein [Jiangella alba]